jgi:hypothetical protein
MAASSLVARRPHRSLSVHCLNPRYLRTIPGKQARGPRARNRGFAGISGSCVPQIYCLPCRRSRVRIPSAAFEKACICRSFSGGSGVVRLRHRTMTGQSCPWRLADAVGRCSLAGDSERPAPWNVCVPAEDRESTAPGRCSCPTGTPPPCPWSQCCLCRESGSPEPRQESARRSPLRCVSCRRPTRSRARQSAGHRVPGGRLGAKASKLAGDRHPTVGWPYWAAGRSEGILWEPVTSLQKGNTTPCMDRR